MPVLGLDLGGTKLAAAVFESDGTILYRNSVIIAGRKGDDVGNIIKDTIHNILGLPSFPIESIGICVPGIYFARDGTVWAPNIAGWDRYPLLAALQSAVDGKNIKTGVDSDRACYILGETWLGAAGGCRDAVFLAVGTGIGAGIMVDGQIVRGYGDIAGALGWLAMSRPYREEYGSCGAFEYYASGEGIIRTAREMLEADKSYTGRLSTKNPDELSTRDVFEAYDTGDELAARVFDECIALWGMAAANIVSTFNPEKLIFGGGVFGPAVQFIERIRNEAARWAQPISMKQVSFESSALGGDAGLYGSGRLAFRLLE
jgi:glucokinase